MTSQDSCRLTAQSNTPEDELRMRHPELLAAIDRMISHAPPGAPEPTAAEQEDERRRRLWATFQEQRGKRYVDCTFENYKQTELGQRTVVAALQAYAADMPQEVKFGRGVFLFGATGTGKDHLLVALSRIAILRHGLNVHWYDGTILAGQLRDRIAGDQPEWEWVRGLVKPDILYLSDPVPQAGPQTPNAVNQLGRVLERRDRDYRPTWVSMNVAGRAEADERLAPAVVDRLRHGAVAAYCDWPTARKCRMVWRGSQAGGQNPGRVKAEAAGGE